MAKSDVEGQIAELVARIELDRKMMRSFRGGHSVAAWVFHGILIVVPALTATSLVDPASAAARVLLAVVSIVGAIGTMYRPAVLAIERRQDAIAGEAMLAQLRIDLLKASDEPARIAALERTSSAFFAMLRQRSSRLVLSSKDVTEAEKT